jgi:hypothetical protein
MLKKSKMFVAILLLSLAMMLSISSVKAQDTVISVIDATDGDDTIMLPPDTPVGTKFLVNVTLTNVTLLAGWQLNITFDPALINISVLADMILPAGHIFEGLDSIGPAPEIGDGWVTWARAIGPSSPVNNFNGSGIICQIRFTTMKNGTGEATQCQIVPTKQGIITTDLRDPDAGPIDFTTTAADYTIPEFPTTTILVVFFTMTLIAVVLARKTLIKRSKFIVAK